MLLPPGAQDQSKPQPKPEVPVFYVKHRWMKNRNLVHGSLVLSFNTEGLAPVKDVGKNREMAETACKWSKGLMKIMLEEDQNPPPVDTGDKVEEKSVVKGKIDVPAEQPEEIVVEKLRDVAEEVVTSAKADAEVFTPIETETTEKFKKKKSTKKAVGKKSSSKDKGE
jgi:lipoate-protein ligase A